MWLATQYGFYSIVRKEGNTFHVRARTRVDLENLLQATRQVHEIHRWPSADYRYRLIVRHQDLAMLMEFMANDLDYGNFKSRISALPDQRDKLHAYHEIWSIMAGFQPD